MTNIWRYFVIDVYAFKTRKKRKKRKRVSIKCLQKLGQIAITVVSECGRCSPLLLASFSLFAHQFGVRGYVKAGTLGIYMHQLYFYSTYTVQVSMNWFS